MTNERKEAIEHLTAETRPMPSNVPFQVRFYRPEDGPGVARLVFAVYGDGYPIDTYYLPERITEASLNGNLHSVVAVTADGDVVSHLALIRSSPPNPNLYELGLGLTLPAYRPTKAFGRCHRLLMTLPGSRGIDAMYGEPVCNQVVTQKMAIMTSSVETALEPAIMPASIYDRGHGGEGRVACLMFFRVSTDHVRPLYVPLAYREDLKLLMDGLNLDRDMMYDACEPLSGVTSLEIRHFSATNVTRCTVIAPGSDLAERIRLLDNEMIERNHALLQCFIPLGVPWSIPVIELLRREGFFIGGILPLWFGDDGLLMQKLYVDGKFEEMRLCSARARRIREIVKADWLRACSEKP